MAASALDDARAQSSMNSTPSSERLRATVEPPEPPGTVPRVPMPKAPVLRVKSLGLGGAGGIPSVNELPHRAYTSSGRAALYAALRLLAPPAGSGVLVPTYHCPTMVAPIALAGLRPVFYAVGEDRLPLMSSLDRAALPDVRAMFVAHFFGLPLDLSEVLRWCRARGIALVEDCAHSYFGSTGDRPVGAWGDFATASLSKFFPMREAGLLASATRPLPNLPLRPPGLHAQLKSVWDVLDVSCHNGELPMLAPLVTFTKRVARARAEPGTTETAPHDHADEQAIRDGCDMARVDETATWISRALHCSLDAGFIVRRRRDNYRLLVRRLAHAPGARLISAHLPDGCVPYVLPLWVDGRDRADRVYATVRALSMPVLRWDRLWPGTPQLPGDAAGPWNRQLLQLLCHQSLQPEQIEQLADSLLLALRTHPPTP